MIQGTYTEAAARLGQELRARRRKLRLTQGEVAELGGTTQRTVSLLENGNPTGKLVTFLAVGEVLGLELTLTDPGARSHPSGGAQR